MTMRIPQTASYATLVRGALDLTVVAMDSRKKRALYNIKQEDVPGLFANDQPSIRARKERSKMDIHGLPESIKEQDVVNLGVMQGEDPLFMTVSRYFYFVLLEIRYCGISRKRNRYWGLL
jgi:hypothetical protein